MAILQKIRQRSGLLIVVIGISLFAFILGGLLQGGLSLSSRNVGEVNGTGIPTQDFMNRVQNAQKQNPNSSSMVYDQIWHAQVRNILYNEQFEELGLRLGRDQVLSVVQTLPEFANNPQFLDAAGNFDLAKFNQFLAQIKEQGAQQWNAWLSYEKQLETYAKEQIYNNMVAGGVYVTSLEAEQVFINENQKVTFDYVAVPYTTVKDDEVKISDEEIATYVNDHKNQFRSQPSRSVEYVFIENKPSEKDVETLKKEVNEIVKGRVVYNQATQKNDTLAGFASAKSAIDFVNMNSDVPYDSTFVAFDQLPQGQKEAFQNANVGEIYGPYENGEYVSISKVLAKKKYKDKVTASHILIAYKGANNAAPTVTLTKEEAKAKAEQLMSEIKQNPSSFASLAQVNSDDPGSKSKGGTYENISKGQMVPAFDAYIFSKPVGEVGIVETPFGFHVLKVDAISEKDGMQLATVSKLLEPSNETQDDIHMRATKVEEQIGEKSLTDIATALELNAHPEATVTAFQEQLPAVGKQREAIQWAFNKDREVGDYKRFSTPDGELIVKVTDINDSDVLDTKLARKTVEPILVREKKAAILSKKISGSSLAEIAKSVNQEIKKDINVTLSNPLVGGFQEPKVVGTAMATAKDQVSKVIDGANGVYVVQTKELTKAPQLPNYNAFKAGVRTGNKNMVNQSLYGALYQNADIEDNRSKIFNQ